MNEINRENVTPSIDVTHWLERRCLCLLELLELQKHSVHSDCTVVLQSGNFPSQAIFWQSTDQSRREYFNQTKDMFNFALPSSSSWNIN